MRNIWKTFLVRSFDMFLVRRMHTFEKGTAWDNHEQNNYFDKSQVHFSMFQG